MPDDSPSSPETPGRQRPNLQDLSKETNEDDLWDLDEDDASEASRPSSAQGEAAEIQAPLPETLRPASASDETRAEPRSSQGRPDARQPDFSVDPGPETPPSAPLEEMPVPKEDPKPDPATESSGSDSVAGKERVGLMILGLLFVGFTAWWLISLFSSVPTTRIGDDQPDFPIDGRFLTIADGITYWREPMRDGPRPDVARADVEFLPVLSLTLKKSDSGIIRVIFRDELGDFVGDSISHGFANGLFDANANATVEFVATDGFKSPGEFNGYRVGDSRWTVEVLEGPSASASGSEFELLFTAPISSNRR